jgi:plasmid stability protein
VSGRANVGSLIVRNLDDELIVRLKEQAKRAGRSAEAEHRSILEQALRPRRSGRELWERLSRGEKADLDFGAGVDQTIKGADFS